MVVRLVMSLRGRDFHLLLPQFSVGKDVSASKVGGGGFCSEVTPINVTAELLPVR